MPQHPMSYSQSVVIASDQSAIPTGGEVASGDPDSGNPVLVAGHVDTTMPTHVAGDRAVLQIDTRGNLRILPALKVVTGADAFSNASLAWVESTTSTSSQLLPTSAPFVFNGTSWDRQPGSAAAGAVNKPFALPASDWNYAAAASGIVNTTTAVTFKAAAGAGVRNYITSIQVQTATLGAATELAIRDGAGGTVLWRTQLQTTAMPLVTVVFPSPLKSTANTLLEVVTLTAATGGVYFNAQGYTAA